MGIAGHLWTVGPHLAACASPNASPGEPWSLVIPQPDGSAVQQTGRLHQIPGASKLLVLVHGLGGSPESYYLWRASHAAHLRGWSTLRVGLRGAGGTHDDLYHAGLCDDLAAALRAPEFSRYASLAVCGFSLGGHIALHLGLRPRIDRLIGIATVCAPLDLARTARSIDAPRAWLYRRHVLSGLIAHYAQMATRRPLPTPLEQIQRVRTLRDWDRLTVVPRFGFASVDHYYAEQSVGPRLNELQLPVLMIASEGDPMVPIHTLDPSLANLPSEVTLRVTPRGGHVGFPANLELGLGPTTGLEAQVLHWLEARTTADPAPQDPGSAETAPSARA